MSTRLIRGVGIAGTVGLGMVIGSLMLGSAGAGPTIDSGRSHTPASQTQAPPGFEQPAAGIVGAPECMTAHVDAAESVDSGGSEVPTVEGFDPEHPAPVIVDDADAAVRIPSPEELAEMPAIDGGAIAAVGNDGNLTVTDSDGNVIAEDSAGEPGNNMRIDGTGQVFEIQPVDSGADLCQGVPAR